MWHLVTLSYLSPSATSAVWVKIVFLKTLMVGFMHGVQIVSNDSVLTETVVHFLVTWCYLSCSVCNACSAAKTTICAIKCSAHCKACSVMQFLSASSSMHYIVQTAVCAVQFNDDCSVQTAPCAVRGRLQRQCICWC